MDNQIPKSIRSAASEYLMLLPGSKIEYLGERDGAAVYTVTPQKKRHIGYPIIFILKGRKVTEVYGEEALIISASFS